MSDPPNKDKRQKRLSLSRTKKSNAKAGVSVNASTTPITSFFSCQPPKLACPLCGQLVPRFKINEHIDLQCQNFQRQDSNATSASNTVVPSSHLSPRRHLSPPNSPDIISPEQKEHVKENQTSPYFKKTGFQDTPQKMVSKTAVRKIDLGSLSSKLSKRSRQVADKTHKDTINHGFTTSSGESTSSETLGGSQKENLNLVDKQDRVIDLTDIDDTGPDVKDAAPASVTPKTEMFHKMFTPKLLQMSSKLTKRKTTSNATKTCKKVRYDQDKNKEPEDVRQSTIPIKEGVNGRDEEQMQKTIIDCNNITAGMEENSIIPVKDNLQDSESEKISKDVKVETSQSTQLPYYLRNFLTVLQAVLENEDDRLLFNDEDMSLIHAFEKLSVMGQKLYVRLFQRKLKWLQVSKLDYDEISSDLASVTQELVQQRFLHSENELEDLGEALDLLPAPELKSLAKTFHLGNSGTQKQQLVEGLLRLSKQKSLFSMAPGQNNICAVMIKRAKYLAGSCVRLNRGPRAVFSRVLLLFSLTDSLDEEEMAAGGQSQLYTILLVKSGRLAFPDYTVWRKAKVFQDRDDLIRYEASMRALQEVTTAMQNGQWEEAFELYSSAKCVWQEMSDNVDFSYQEELPVFLRSFTTGWAYTRILSRGVEILQRLRRYEEAVVELQSLLSQSVYCQDSRGRWWDRLALNLHQHLKKPEQAICAIRDGLADPLVRTGHKLSLHQRAARMKDSASCRKYCLKLRDLPTIHVQDVKHVTIQGQLFPHEGGTGKSRFLIPMKGNDDESSNATVICSVEDLSLAHYQKQGFNEGIHGEGSTFSTLFALLLWDIIFIQGIPDVFRNPYQTCPLDLYTDGFYENRKEAIDSRVELICNASVETLHSMLEDVWTTQEGKVCSLVSWERFSSLQQAQSLVSCLSGPFLAGVIMRMAKDYRHCRGGLPDLVVWNTSNNTYKLVEVKGPNDRLSQKQQIWLDELQKLGADVEVCHVTATGAKGSRLE
ncbi:fanconi-associated nuclease 1 [Periophthalmus magnuspinnatus]|uniref:fanconi-associated nuclease 1 n=1 Tax=Periophthalmus magnuspinnatus TaxID=409849 RepID=UPI00145ABB6F|nr:fanconi-associated nuclease 1 [Periophthalmus magnuspinnatus]